ncbi:MAG: hypothetical protein HN350_11195 [Phycisphaerales bacterium]|jgi:hypothetical protein|nr:hypothetical protein [Phycisphaerales bacterium]
MTTLPRYNGVDDLIRRLQTVHVRRHTIRIMTFVAGALAVIVASLLFTTLAGGYWPDQPPALLRWALAISCLTIWGGALGILLVRGALWNQTPAQTARFVEQASPELKNNLINSILLAQDTEQVSPQFVQQAINETVNLTQDADLSESLSYRQLKRWGLGAALAGLLLGAMVILQPGPFQRGLTAALTPWKYVPRVNKIDGVKITPGDTTVLTGQRVVITADIPALDEQHYIDQTELAVELAKLKPRVIVAGRETPILMLGGAGGKFTCDLNAVMRNVDYAVIVGSDRWPTDKPYYTVKVIDDITVKARHLLYSFPPYTQKEPQEVTDSSGLIEASVGSTVKMTITLSSPVPAITLDIKGKQALAMAPSNNGKTFTAALPIDADGGYRMLLQDAQERTIRTLPDMSADNGEAPLPTAGAIMDGYYPIRAIPDAPPTIKFLLPGRDLTVAPGAKVRMKIKLADKFGLDNLTLMINSSGRVSPLLARNLDGSTDELIVYEYTVPADLPDDGTIVLTYNAMTSDQRNLPRLKLTPQIASSKTYKITVQDATKLAEESAKRYEILRKKLLEILNIQLSQRVNTAICKTQHKKLADIQKTGAEIVIGQQAVRNGMLWLLTKHKFDQDLIAIQQEIARMFANEARLAVDQAGIVVKLGAMNLRNKACDELGGSQDRIIESIQSMLAIMPELVGKKETKTTAADDLPPDVKAKLAELKAKLAEFTEGQKKVIQAAKRLTKMPVDTFQEDEEKILSDLEAAEDNWEKFINEALADFSKLAEQDFSNPALLKELLSVKCDVTMAKDALSKKATEIAVAAAGAAKTKAEKEMDNIEKWLPDKPDREKWSMEDPTGGQENIEMPDLPEELEDLVGDLLEEEEDLFEEMADVSAKATISGEKGIGWDAMDGPISSMAAKGVTGNQLPNTSEISGRSGEGRQGKSTGEFVEDKAVGKGGRRTPTRLTPEPFSKGVVDDRGSEAEGGSTGGGKISGSGAEGLEGPVPPELKKEMKRLSGKQASLINKAEQIRAQFKVTDHSNLKLFQAVTLMNRVKDDLDKFRYHNALRNRKEVVGALQDTAMLLSGNIDVQSDASSSMPKYIKDDIADAMNGTMPEEFREVLKQYYRRVNQEGK